MFENMLAQMRQHVTLALSHVEMRAPDEADQSEAQPAQANTQAAQKPKAGGANAAAAKVPRNAPCPCGSGKKYKYCHGKLS